MAIIQEAFHVPTEIMTKISTGEYRLTGAVIRKEVGPNKGQIVRHIIPEKTKVKEELLSIGDKTIQLAKNNKKTLVIIGVAAGAAAVGAAIYKKVKKDDSETLSNFDNSLKKYFDAIETGNLNEKVIGELIAALSQLRRHRLYDKFIVQLSANGFDDLVNVIDNYTKKLEEDNLVDVIEEAQYTSENLGDAIVNLHEYLYKQKRVFEIGAA